MNPLTRLKRLLMRPHESHHEAIEHIDARAHEIDAKLARLKLLQVRARILARQRTER